MLREGPDTNFVSLRCCPALANLNECEKKTVQGSHAADGRWSPLRPLRYVHAYILYGRPLASLRGCCPDVVVCSEERLPDVCIVVDSDVLESGMMSCVALSP